MAGASSGALMIWRSWSSERARMAGGRAGAGGACTCAFAVPAIIAKHTRRQSARRVVRSVMVGAYSSVKVTRMPYYPPRARLLQPCRSRGSQTRPSADCARILCRGPGYTSIHPAQKKPVRWPVESPARHHPQKPSPTPPVRRSSTTDSCQGLVVVGGSAPRPIIREMLLLRESRTTRTPGRVESVDTG